MIAAVAGPIDQAE